MAVPKFVRQTSRRRNGPLPEGFPHSPETCKALGWQVSDTVGMSFLFHDGTEFIMRADHFASRFLSASSRLGSLTFSGGMPEKSHIWLPHRNMQFGLHPRQTRAILIRKAESLGKRMVFTDRADFSLGTTAPQPGTRPNRV